MGKASRYKRERQFRLGIGQYAPKSALRNCSEEQKISPALIELIDPYIDDEISLEELRFIVGIGAIAWNLAMLPESLRGPRLEEIELTDIDPEMDDESAILLESLIQELIERKLILFPGDARVITGWDVRKKSGQYFITAVAIIDMLMDGNSNLH